MSIHRKELVTRHNPRLTEIDYASPFTVGNGEFAFTADVTGLQTLYKEYKEALPLCTMSQWGWHTKPVSKERYAYTMDDLAMTEFDYQGRTVTYPKCKIQGNEEVYDWLRTNPHRLNLGRIGLLYQGNEIKKENITEIHQELKLYEGKLISNFKLYGENCHVETCCDSNRDTVAFHIASKLLEDGSLSVFMKFPYGSPNITASDWEKNSFHDTEIIKKENHLLTLKRILDQDSYYVMLSSEAEIETEVYKEQHLVQVRVKEDKFSFVVEFSPKEKKTGTCNAGNIFQNSLSYWNKFWEEGGIIRLNQSKDPRAIELERRIILSQYLLTVNSCGSAPPQETGLTCNSWYGKMHLEMYLWHCAWAPLWNHNELLERSLPWYIEHIPQARENAARNYYKGSRWPKMIAREGVDCPSQVAPLLVWQQPHIILMLDLMRRQNKNKAFMEKYWILVQETADFMADIVVYNGETKKYDIASPVIPAQECHRPEVTKNPTYEVEYWRYSLKIALQWAEELGRKPKDKWKEVADNMADLPIGNGRYLAHENCPDTFEAFNKDHPSMLAAFGVLPNDHIDERAMKATLNKVIECWKYNTLWGWDFAVMAMTATRLKDPETAIKILLLDTPKNNYVVSGNNRQILRKDLPLYLPGNGSLLLAIPLMAAGYDGCKESAPGFPKDGNWVVEYENIETYI